MFTARRIGYPAWLIVLFAATLALGTDEFVISGILPAVADDLDVTAGAAGLLVTAFALAFCLGAPVLAVLVDAYNKKAVLVGGLTVFALANAAMAVCPDFEIGLVLRVLAGLAAAAISPTAMAIAAMAAPAGQTGRFLSVVTAGLTVALFTGVPLGTLLGTAYSWRATFTLIAVVAAAVAVLVAWLAPSIPGAQRTPLAVRLSPVRDGRVMALVGAMFFCGAGGLMFYSYLGTILGEKLQASDSEVTAALLVVGLVGVGAVFFGGALSDRAGARPARLGVIGGHALALLLLGLFLQANGEYGVPLLGLVAFWSLFAWALSPVVQASIMEMAPDRAMLVVALGISGLYGGSGVGAAAGGYLIDHAGPGAVPFLGSGFVILALALATVRAKTASPTLSAQSTASAPH